MFAAESAGLSTCAMSGFDEGRMKKVLGIPRRFDLPMIVAVGYPAERLPLRTRLPIEDVVHWL
jgi:nitroreductase